MMKATAGKGKVNDIRKVTNFIIARSGMKKVSTGRTFSLLPWHGASGKGSQRLRKAVQQTRSDAV